MILVGIFSYQVCIYISNLDFRYLFRLFWVLANYSAIITFAEVSKGDPWKSEKGKSLDLGIFQRKAEQLSEKNLEISFGKKNVYKTQDREKH